MFLLVFWWVFLFFISQEMRGDSLGVTSQRSDVSGRGWLVNEATRSEGFRERESSLDLLFSPEKWLFILFKAVVYQPAAS